MRFGSLVLWMYPYRNMVVEFRKVQATRGSSYFRKSDFRKSDGSMSWIVDSSGRFFIGGTGRPGDVLAARGGWALGLL